MCWVQGSAYTEQMESGVINQLYRIFDLKKNLLLEVIDQA